MGLRRNRFVRSGVLPRPVLAAACIGLIASASCSPERTVESLVARNPGVAYTVLNGVPLIEIASCGRSIGKTLKLSLFRQPDEVQPPRLITSTVVRVPTAEGPVTTLDVSDALQRLGIDNAAQVGDRDSIRTAYTASNDSAFVELTGPWPNWPTALVSKGEDDPDGNAPLRNIADRPLDC